MVRAVVGANWGDEGKGKSSHCIHYHPVFSIIIQQASSVMV